MNKISRTALITGSGQNIGRACALELAKNGFDIVINGFTNQSNCNEVANNVRAVGRNASVIMADIGDREQVDSLCAEVTGKFGVVDVLINNAAIRPTANFLDISDNQWERVMNVNFQSALWLCRSALPGMIEKGWGRIINFSGMNAMAGFPGKPHVTVSKHALWGLTKSLALEFGANGITCNLISPGTIMGEVKTETQISNSDQLLSKIPVNRFGTPGDIASCVNLLVSESGGFVNGQMLQINGGAVS